MATQGPTATTYDASTFAHVKDWAGSVQGTNAALAAFGWTQTADANQIDWTNATVAPFATNSYPNVTSATSATAGGPPAPYKVHAQGNWVSGNTYNYLDVVRSTVGGGGTGNDYLLSRYPFIITNVSVTAGVATITCPNNLAAGETVKVTQIYAAQFLLGQTLTVLAGGLSSSQFTANVTGVTTYPSTAEGGSANITQAQAQIVVTSTTRPETDTKNYVPYYYEMWKTNDTEVENITNVSRTSGGLATFVCNNRFKAGFNVTVAGLTNVPSLNGTWCVASATSTQFTVLTNILSAVGSTADSGTATYTLSPIYLKLEYWANIISASNPPQIRIAFGGGTDGVGNLTGNRIASDQVSAAGSTSVTNSVIGTGSAMPFIDLRSQTASNTSSIWRNIWSGANSRFGQCMWYNRNDTNAAAATQQSSFWIVERGRDGTGNNIDDYYTILAGCAGTTQALAINDPVTTRQILKPNPQVIITQVQVDGSNNVTITYTSSVGYQFQIGAIAYITDVVYANFLNGQFVTITSVTSNTFTGAISAHAAYGPLNDTGFAIQSTSSSSLTPISGTGGVCWMDRYINTPRTQQNSLTVNGNTPMLPVFPVPGYVGNPMTMAMSVTNADAGAHDSTATITLYGATRTYYQPQGTNNASQPYLYFGNGSQGNMNIYLRWD